MTAELLPSEIPVERRTAVLTDVMCLLTDDVSEGYPNWFQEIGGRKLFYIRGYTTYAKDALPKGYPVTSSSQFETRQKALLAEKTAWQIEPFDWATKYSHTHLVSAVSTIKRNPVSFTKAVESIVMLEAIAEKKPGYEKTNIYNYLWIQPAAYYICDFNRSTLGTLMAADDNFIESLQRATGQGSPSVFFDMADGFRTTRQLASLVHEHIKTHYRAVRVNGVPAAGIGDVQCFTSGRVFMKCSSNEMLI